MSSLIDVIHSYKGMPHQDSALAWLSDDISPDAWQEFLWKWRSAEPAPAFTNPLDVPYQSQNDNASGTGWRECFSSSCAMAAMYHKRCKSDDQYNLQRKRFGDTTDSHAQVRALESLGLKAAFHTDGTPTDIRALIDKGNPVPAGFLHHSSVRHPTGGGHWLIITGYDTTGWWVNDPNGECDLVNGNYPSHANGAKKHYSYANWTPRWMPEGSLGWYMDIRP